MTQQLNAQDAQFLYIQSGQTLTHVMGINIYDPSTAPGGKVRFRDIVEHVRGRLDTSPVFKRKLYRLPLDIDHPYWVEDPNFELEAHITHVRLPEPGDWRQFCIQVARHFSRPMDMNRPLWDLYIIEGLDRIPGIAPGSFAGLMRIHHSAIDGASGAHMFVALADADARGTPAIPVKPGNFELGQVPSPLEIATRAIGANMTSPVRFAGALMKLSPALIGAAQKNFNEGGAGIPKTRFNAPISIHKVFDATEFAIADLSRIRKHVEGATLNDVILAICSGALRKYLIHHKELPKDSLVAVAPINRRTSAREAETPGNNISAMNVELATQLADPIDRLRAIQAYTSQAKEAKTGLSARMMTDLTKHIPGATMAGVARLLTNPRLAPKAANVFISNVPGPQVPLYMAGARITHQYAMAPLSHNMGLFIATPSYDGKVTFNITSERKILPDIAFLRECLDDAFSELLEARPKTAQPRGGKNPSPIATDRKRMVRPRPVAAPKRGAKQTGGATETGSKPRKRSQPSARPKRS
jgi:WS/DGAT/MGAT family acyltransferase